MLSYRDTVDIDFATRNKFDFICVSAAGEMVFQNGSFRLLFVMWRKLHNNRVIQLRNLPVAFDKFVVECVKIINFFCFQKKTTKAVAQLRALPGVTENKTKILLKVASRADVDMVQRHSMLLVVFQFFFCPHQIDTILDSCDGVVLCRSLLAVHVPIEQVRVHVAATSAPIFIFGALFSWPSW